LPLRDGSALPLLREGRGRRLKERRLPSRRLNKRRPEDRRCLMSVAFGGENGFRIGTGTLPTATQPELTDKRRLRCEKLKHHLHAPNDFVEVVLTKLRIRFAEIGPGMDVVDHQFEVVAVDVVIQAAGDGMNTVVAHLPGI